MTAAAARDVVVVGGGPAGIAAALCAAETGVDTLLIESAGALGGNVSQALVHTFCGLYLADTHAPIPANPGFPIRLYQGLRDCGAAGEPERAGRVWVVATRPTRVAAYAAERCALEATLECWLSSRVVAAELATGPERTSRLQVRRPGPPERLQEVNARIVIDTSGAGALGPLGRAEFDLAPADRLQASSYIFGLRGVPAEALEGFGRMKLTVAVARACADELLPRGCESILVRPGGPAGEAFVTLNMPPLDGRRYDPLDEDYCRDMESRARSHALAIAAHLRRERVGFEACAVSHWPKRLGVREGRRLVGLDTLEAQDVVGGRKHDREIARSAWPIELWDDSRRARMTYPEGACSISLGCLVSRSHPMLGMAGRCLSASHEALGAVRVIGTALATGAAIGRAAALAVTSGCALGAVEPRRVRPAALGGEA